MNTRVAVPLTKEAYDAVSFLAELGGVSRGRFLADILEAAVPSLLAIQAAYRAAMAVEGEERASLVAGMAEAEKRLLSVLAETVPVAVDQDTGRSGARSPKREERAPERRSDPPATNRGVHTSPVKDQGSH